MRRDIAGRDTKPRVTPELIDFHIKRAHALRKEAFATRGALSRRGWSIVGWVDEAKPINRMR